MHIVADEKTYTIDEPDQLPFYLDRSREWVRCRDDQGRTCMVNRGLITAYYEEIPKKKETKTRKTEETHVQKINDA